MYILQYWNDFRVNEKNLADIALKVWNHFPFYEEVMILTFCKFKMRCHWKTRENTEMLYSWNEFPTKTLRNEA